MGKEAIFTVGMTEMSGQQSEMKRLVLATLEFE